MLRYIGMEKQANSSGYFMAWEEMICIQGADYIWDQYNLYY